MTPPPRRYLAHTRLILRCCVLLCVVLRCFALFCVVLRCFALLCFVVLCCALHHQDGMLFSANDLLDGKNLDKVLSTLIEFAKRMVRRSGGVVGADKMVVGPVERLLNL